MEAPNITGYDEAPNSLPDGAKKSWKTVPDQLENITGDFLLIEDLLDFSNEEIAGPIGSEDGPGDFPNDAPFNADSSTITAETATSTDRGLLSSNDSTEKSSHISSEDHLQFNIYNCNPGVDFCVPCDDLAELEWLSNFVEDSFSTGDVHREISVLEANSCSERYTSEILPVPGRARSKRSRAPVCNWVSRVVLSPSVNSSATTLENASTAAAVSSTESPDALPQGGAAESLLVNKFSKKKKLLHKASDDRHTNNSVLQTMRKCTHCGTQKTPQWRAGPMGPKTLCNACGVRFKSGRLLPEYRPAASPTFIVTKHSNSHKKVLEMRRHKDHYGMYDEDDDQPMEELVQGLQDYRCSEEQSYFSHSDDACLLHNTRQDFI